MNTALIDKATQQVVDFWSHTVKISGLPQEHAVLYTENDREGITSAEILAVISDVRRQKIIDRLAVLDLESVRPLRAVQAGTHSDFDTQKLEQLETEAAALRAELQTLGG